jgi:hypothetical protein
MFLLGSIVIVVLLLDAISPFVESLGDEIFTVIPGIIVAHISPRFAFLEFVVGPCRRNEPTSPFPRDTAQDHDQLFPDDRTGVLLGLEYTSLGDSGLELKLMTLRHPNLSASSGSTLCGALVRTCSGGHTSGTEKSPERVHRGSTDFGSIVLEHEDQLILVSLADSDHLRLVVSVRPHLSDAQSAPLFEQPIVLLQPNETASKYVEGHAGHLTLLESPTNHTEDECAHSPMLASIWDEEGSRLRRWRSEDLGEITEPVILEQIDLARTIVCQDPAPDKNENRFQVDSGRL